MNTRRASLGSSCSASISLTLLTARSVNVIMGTELPPTTAQPHADPGFSLAPAAVTQTIGALLIFSRLLLYGRPVEFVKPSVWLAGAAFSDQCPAGVLVRRGKAPHPYCDGSSRANRSAGRPRPS